MILMIDNYDSFTYNIVHYLGELGEEIVVKRNDEIKIKEIKALNPKSILISPGPSHPYNSGICLEVIEQLKGSFPILGICLGLQCIGAVFGAKIVQAKKIYHGKSSKVSHDGKGVFQNLANPLISIRYHSLVIDPNEVPDILEITATSEDQEIMGIRHRDYLIEGVQFHPESIGSHQGHDLLANFLKLVARLS